MTKSKSNNAAAANYPCAICSGSVTSRQGGISCALCSGWTHVSCPGGNGANMSKTMVDALAADGGESLSFFCVKCRPQKEKVFSSFREFEQFKIDIADEIAKLQIQIDDLKKVPHTPISMPGAINIQEEVEEALQKERKKLNVVLVGVPENDPNKIECDEDKTHVSDICNALTIDPSSVTRVFRDGKIPRGGTLANGKPFSRVIKVFFNDKQSKLAFLRGYRDQRDGSMHSYARHDMTYRQRMEDKALRSEVVAKRIADPSMFYFIRGGRIMSRHRAAHETNTNMLVPTTASQLSYGQPPSQ